MALAEIKQLFSQLGYGPIDEHTRELTAQTISRVRTSSEARIGFSAFLEKRLPRWTATSEVQTSTET
jgi:methylglutaconyl-CoA hydratase